MSQDTIESQGPNWLLLIHSLPPKPDYLRVKVRRRLQRLGAQPLKNTVYVLPHGDDALEDFEWLRREIVADGGEATICEASFLAGTSDQEMRAMFENGTVESADEASDAADRVKPGRTWVTRQGVKVDRMSSAWLIRRFVDQRARFKFVAPRGYRPAEGELLFDMYEGGYGHEEGRCTFETLQARFGLNDPALTAIGHMVHDLDCKDERYQLPETAGFAAMVAGVVAQHEQDEARLEASAVMLDALYAKLEVGG